MKTVDPYDKYLDPPDDPVCSDCDECKGTFRTDDLTKLPKKDKWLCVDCLEERENKEILKDENDALKAEVERLRNSISSNMQAGCSCYLCQSAREVLKVAK